MAIQTGWSYGEYKVKIISAAPEESWSYGEYGFFWEEAATTGPTITQSIVGR
ncbi:MAG: hypothetical protein GXP46_01925 [Deferribacteres bacterium]|nr:hypothetical protein [Deferribacteres bacterium]